MSDVVPEVDDAVDQDADQITAATVLGHSTRAIAKRFNRSAANVEHVLDSVLPPVNERARLRSIRVCVAQLDSLLQKFLTRALNEGDTPCGLLAVKILERKCLLLGLDAPTRIDPVQLALHVEPAPTSVSRIEAVIARICASNGNGSEPSADNEQPDSNGGNGPQS
jgi:hypothetical protein